jgi:uncharacterized protein (TIGR00369 family)
MFEGRRGDLWVLALRIAPEHVNARGRVHGGLLSTIADVGLGHAVAMADDRAHPITVSLTVDYLAPASLGGWLEVRTRVLKSGRRLASSRAEIFSDDRIVARASAIFAVVRPGETS